MPSRLGIAAGARGGADGLGGERIRQVGVVDGAIGGPERLVALAALFPNVSFQSIGPAWPDRTAAEPDILIAPAEASSIDEAIHHLKSRHRRTQVIVALSDADVGSTRRLVREGAADVLPAPVSEAALALSLERLLSKQVEEPEGARKSGEVVAVLKAGGGVGATALATQLTTMLAARGDGKVCLVDMDIQFGVAGLYMDLPEAVTLADLLSAGAKLSDTEFSSVLAAHSSGARVLAAPRTLMPLETVGAQQIDGLVRGLRRDFGLTLIDLPAVWTAWTNRILTLADRIVLVTQLTVPHIHLVKRQMQMLATQKLDGIPLILVCNAASQDQQASLSIKSAEKALGRTFDILVPEDRRVMTAAINQGLVISAVRRGTKLEKAIVELADKVVAHASTSPIVRKRW